MTDTELLSPDQYDAAAMFDYLQWRSGDFYDGDFDLGSPTSAYLAAGIEYAHDNSAAIRLLTPRLTELDLTVDDAMELLESSAIAFSCSHDELAAWLLPGEDIVELATKQVGVAQKSGGYYRTVGGQRQHVSAYQRRQKFKNKTGAKLVQELDKSYTLTHPNGQQVRGIPTDAPVVKSALRGTHGWSGDEPPPRVPERAAVRSHAPAEPKARPSADKPSEETKAPSTPQSEPSAKQEPQPVSRKPQVNVPELAYQQAVANGGVSINLKGDMPSDGFAYSPYPDAEQVVNRADFTPDVIDAYRSKHFDRLQQPGNVLGIWADGDQVYLDISRVGPANGETLNEAIQGEQLAVFDLGRMQEVRLGERTPEGYRAFHEGTNHPYLAARRAGEGSERGGSPSGTPSGTPEVRSDSTAAKPATKEGSEQPVGPLTDEEYAAYTKHVASTINDALANKQTTEDLYALDAKKGIWQPERARIHRDIINDMYTRGSEGVPTEGKAVIAGGLGGAGKSTVLRGSAGLDPSKYLTVNPDDVKEEMAARGLVPSVDELSPMEASTLVHEEASHIANLIAKRAYADHRNMIWDITLSSQASGQRRIDELRANNYSIQGIFVQIPVETSVQRAESRHRRGLEKYREGKGNGGRYLPPAIIRSSAAEPQYPGAPVLSKNRLAFDKLNDQFDEWALYDNSGKAPRLITSGTNPPSVIPAKPTPDDLALDEVKAAAREYNKQYLEPGDLEDFANELDTGVPAIDVTYDSYGLGTTVTAQVGLRLPNGSLIPSEDPRTLATGSLPSWAKRDRDKYSKWLATKEFGKNPGAPVQVHNAREKFRVPATASASSNPRDSQISGLRAQGMTQREIAVRVGISPSQVSSSLQRSRDGREIPQDVELRIYSAYKKGIPIDQTASLYDLNENQVRAIIGKYARRTPFPGDANASQRSKELKAAAEKTKSVIGDRATFGMKVSTIDKETADRKQDAERARSFANDLRHAYETGDWSRLKARPQIDADRTKQPYTSPWDYQGEDSRGYLEGALTDDRQQFADRLEEAEDRATRAENSYSSARDYYAVMAETNETGNKVITPDVVNASGHKIPSAEVFAKVEAIKGLGALVGEEITNRVTERKRALIDEGKSLDLGFTDQDRARIAREVLSDFRSMGRVAGIQHDRANMTFSGDRKAGQAAFDYAEEQFPTGWIQHSSHTSPPIQLNYDPSIRGKYSDNGEMISGPSPLNENVPGSVTTVHELGHRMEHTVPGLRQAEWAYMYSRISHRNPDGTWTVEQPEKLTALVQSSFYRDDEEAFRDQFTHPYMGKDYGANPDSYYELVSMGGPALLVNPGTTESYDEDYMNFIRGLWAAW